MDKKRKRIIFDVSDDEHNAIKIRATQDNKSIKDYIMKLINIAWLAEKNNKKPLE